MLIRKVSVFLKATFHTQTVTQHLNLTKLNTENYIILENISKWNLEKIIQDYSNLYSEFDFTNGIKLLQKSNSLDSSLLLFSRQPDFDGFCFLVNYLRYPIGIESLNVNPIGFYKIENLTIKYEFSIGDWIMVFVSKNDNNYDNVNILNVENEQYTYDFNGAIKKLSNSEFLFDSKELDLTEYNQIAEISVKKKIIPSTNHKKISWRKIADLLAGIVCLGLSIFMFATQDITNISNMFGAIFLGTSGIFVLWQQLKRKK